MFSKKNLIILSIVAIALLIVVYKMFFTSLEVIGYKVTKQDALNGITSTGVVSSFEDVDVGPDFTSTIVKKMYKEGEFVKKGQILAYMDKGTAVGDLETAKGSYRASFYALKDLQTEPRAQNVQIAQEQFKRASLDIKIADEQVIKADQKLKDAKLDKTKLEILYKQGAISLRDYEKSQYNENDAYESVIIAQKQRKSAKITEQELEQNYLLVKDGTKIQKVQSQKGNVEATKGQIISAESTLESKIIRAPINGYISNKFLTVGDVASPTRPILRIQNLDSLYIRVEVEEADIKNLKIGQKAIVVFDAYPDQLFDGKVFDIIKNVNNITGTFDVKVKVVSKKGIKILPGMTSDVTVITDKIKNAEIVPKNYIYEENGFNYVYLLHKGRAKKIKVKILPFDNSKDVIETPIENNSVVLYNENKKLKNKIKVKIIDYDTLENTNGRLK